MTLTNLARACEAATRSIEVVKGAGLTFSMTGDEAEQIIKAVPKLLAFVKAWDALDAALRDHTKPYTKLHKQLQAARKALEE